MVGTGGRGMGGMGWSVPRRGMSTRYLFAVSSVVFVAAGLQAFPRGPAAATGAGAAPAVKGGRLSPRLASIAGAGVLSARAQASALSLPSGGPGSLVRRADGRVLVEIR